MDFMYMPDVSYPSLRNTTYNFPEQQNPWNQPNKSGRPQHQQKSSSKDHKDCPMCKANRRRRLANYIRSKSRQDSESAIEEEEEEEQDGKQQQ